jgi:hypothetical protein
MGSLPWKILTAENLQNRHIILVSRCCLCKRDGETVEHLLLHCFFTKEVCEGNERSVAELKQLVLKTLFEWVSVLGCLPFSNFLDFLDLCSFWV